MSERKWSSILGVVAPAVSGLAGVIVGAHIAGHYQLETQRLHAQQAETVERYQGSRALSLDLAAEATQYLTELSYVATITAVAPQNDKDLDNTAVKVFEANAYVGELLRAKGDPERLKAVQARGKILGEVYVALYTEVARFRLSSLPAAGRDELIMSFLQLLTQSRAKPQ